MSGAATLNRTPADGQQPERRAPLGQLDLHNAWPSDPVPLGLLQRLRALMPKRPLGWGEAEQVAERQANRLRAELGGLGPRLREEDLAQLPWLTITRRERLPTSGLATKTDFGWLVVIKGDEARVRQRFSLAHEIKHVVDDELMDQVPGGLYPASAGYSAHERAERVCDRFAAALLMPKVLLRADWADGLQDIAKLAKRYDVSRAAMRVRLTQLGLIVSTPRCPPSNLNHGHASGAAA